MRCKTCDYPLWQIRDRRCPECGANFRPSEFDFVLNSVRFCCPHCDQAYYGTGERGHLTPRRFACVSCGRDVDMDEMVLLPTEGVREEQTKVEMNPWLERDKRGFLRAWLSTTLRALGTPNRLMEATPDNAPTMPAAWYALITNGVYVCTGLLLPIGLLMLFAVVGAGGGGAGVGMIGGLTAFYLGSVAAVLIGAFIWAAATHLILVLTGPVAAGLGRTTQCLLYSSAAMLILAVPCLGFYFSFISGIWWAVAATIMVLAAQRVETWRAIVAVIVPVVVIMGATAAVIAGAIWYSASQASAAAQAAQAQAQAQAQAAATQALAAVPNPYPDDPEASRIHQWGAALLAHHAAQEGWPTHPAELLGSGAVWPGQFVASRREPDAPSWAPQAARPTANVRIGTMSIGDFQMADATTQEAAVRSAMTGIPEGAIACRVGDTVFTYYGIRLADMPGELWLVVGHDQPAADTRKAATIWVFRADGQLDRFAAKDLDANLSEQNALRARVGLSPIPDPQTITAERAIVPE